ncbi:vitamin K epoxide reductase family protein [Lysinimonas soli]|uniref:Vitamin K epoxide reductase family protein n=1 Tax=Lysinimonas soli TaxID=1074233 RepID=A0ABW0NQ03_9MICO
MSESAPAARASRAPWLFPVVLIVTGAIGWFASFRLTLDKIQLLEHPAQQVDCNFSVLVQCERNIESWQGAVFGFPNPLIGLSAFIAPIAVGVALLAGARFARWFWIAFNAGVAGAMAFVIWLMAQSIFVLGTLCPYCMLTWSIVIPMFFAVTTRNAREGVFGTGLMRPGARFTRWLITADVVCYVIVGTIAQLRLSWIQSVFS